MPTDSCDGHYRCNEDTGAKICLDGWTGKNCKDSLFVGILNEECPSKAALIGCSNGGTCFNQRCCCPPGFAGDTCDIDTTLCASKPCLNGATCIGNDTEYQCICSPG